jgi:hypothetical protein
MSTKESAARPRSDARRRPETIRKRRAARAFNELLLGPKTAPDGRHERRRTRLLRELRQHASGKAPLKPVDVLGRVDALLELDTELAVIEAAVPPPPSLPASPELVQRLRALHEAYGFREACYRFVGIDARQLRIARVKKARGSAAKRGAA